MPRFSPEERVLVGYDSAVVTSFQHVDYVLSLALADFIKWGLDKYSSSTVRTYSDLIGRFVAYVGDKPVQQCTLKDVVNYSHHLRQRGYHDSSRAYMLISLRQFFKYLFMQRITDFDYRLITPPRYESQSWKPVEAADARAMIDRIAGKNFRELRDKALIAFLYASGVRNAELTKIKANALDLENRYTSIISGKNAVRRMVFWTEEIQPLLEQYLLERKRYASSPYLFVSLDRKNRGGQLSTRSIERIIEKHRPKADIVPHGFRHGLGFRAVRSGIHPRYIQKILGHKNINSSQVYMDYYDKDVVEAYQTIERGSVRLALGASGLEIQRVRVKMEEASHAEESTAIERELELDGEMG